MTDIATWEQPAAIPSRIDSWTNVLSDVVDLSRNVADTDFVPEALRGNVAAVTATILYGREIGLPPMRALRSIHIVKGRPGLAAEAMRALSLAAGHEIEYLRSDAAICTVRGRRRGASAWHSVTWTSEQAKQAQLGGDGWRKYPRAMLKARATSELCRDVFADVIGGFSAIEDFDVLPDGISQEDAQTVEETSAPPARTVRRGRPPKTPTVPPRDAEPAKPLDATPGGRAVPQPRPVSSPQPTDVVVPSHVVVPRGLDEGPEEETPRLDPGPWEEEPLPLPIEEDPVPIEEDPPVPPVRREPDEPASIEQGHKVFALLNELNATEPRERRIEVARAILQRDVTTFKELTRADASRLIDTLEILSQSPDGEAQLIAIVRNAG